MQFARATRGTVAACLVLMLVACGGGGGGGDEPRTSTVTLETSTSATSAGTFTTQNHRKFTEDTGTVLGSATSIEFKFSNGSEAGFSYIDSDRSIYIVGFSDRTGDYMCGSVTATNAIGVITCPSNIQVDIGRKTVTFTSAELEEVNALEANIKLSGNLQWN